MRQDFIMCSPFIYIHIYNMCLLLFRCFLCLFEGQLGVRIDCIMFSPFFCLEGQLEGQEGADGLPPVLCQLEGQAGAD